MAISDTHKRRKSERLNFRVTPEARQRLERLLKRSEAHTLTEVLQNALSVYDEVLDIQHRGGSLTVDDPKSGEYRWRIR